MADADATSAVPSTAPTHRGRFALLLGSILAAFAVQGIAQPGRWEQVIASLLLAATLLLAFWTADARPMVMRAAVTFVVAVVALSFVEAAFVDTVDAAETRIANLLLVTLAPPAIVVGVIRSFRARDRVTIEAVFGVLCLYLLVGMFFAFVYGVVDHFGGPFFAANASASVAHCLYYSFTTLTTTGYGDFTAATNLGHTLSVTEALTGQIYLVTVVAVIVSNLGRSRSEIPVRQR